RVANTAEQSWVGQRAFDGVILAAQRVAKLFSRDVERFDAATIQRSQGSLTAHHLNRGTFFGARFGEKERALFELKHGQQQLRANARLLSRLTPPQAAGNHEMNHKEEFAIEDQDDAFPDTTNRSNGRAVCRVDRRID